jgi:hypothetical protein
VSIGVEHQRTGECATRCETLRAVALGDRAIDDFAAVRFIQAVGTRDISSPNVALWQTVVAEQHVVGPERVECLTHALGDRLDESGLVAETPDRVRRDVEPRALQLLVDFSHRRTGRGFGFAVPTVRWGETTMRMRRTRTGIAIGVALATLFSAGISNAEGVNNLMAGLNGVLTSPIDPFLYAVEPPEQLEDIWGSPVTSTTLGFFSGLLMLPFRAVMGTLDIVLFPFWIFPTLSPEAKFDLFPFYEVEYE